MNLEPYASTTPVSTFVCSLQPVADALLAALEAGDALEGSSIFVAVHGLRLVGSASSCPITVLSDGLNSIVGSMHAGVNGLQ